MKNSRSALMALLTAGGLWAWQNRDKIQGWIGSQRGAMGGQYGADRPALGPTRRLGADTDGSTSTGPRMYDEPSNTQF